MAKRRKLKEGVTAKYECKCACGHRSGPMDEDPAYEDKASHLRKNPSHNPRVYITLQQL